MTQTDIQAPLTGSALPWSEPPEDNAASGGSIPRRIAACEVRTYHIAGGIQPHGVLLAFDPETWLISRVSANCGPIFDRALNAVLGCALSTLFTPDCVRGIEAAVTAHRREAASRRTSLALTIAGPRPCSTDALLYRSGDVFCIELDNSGSGDVGHDIGMLSARFFEMVETVARADMPSEQLATTVCEAIREVTGFDRIYYCRFDRHGHGHVLGESGGGALPDFLDHHFPATDVPSAARAIYVLNPFRLIADVDAEPVEIFGSGGPMDLTLSSCRAIAPTHLQYLRNMGVRASVSFSVVEDASLLAMFGGHHREPRRLPFNRMAACQHLVELFRTRFEYLKLREQQEQTKARADALFALSAEYGAEDHDLGRFIAMHRDAFMGLARADDLLCRFEGHTHLGHTLPPGAAMALLDFLARTMASGLDVWQTDCLAEANPAFAALLPAAAGALAVPLDLTPGNILVWLRAETVVAQRWSGDPTRPVVFDAEGAVGPRTSFAAYVRDTRGTCGEWSSSAIEIARMSRQAFSQVLAAHYERGMRAAAEQANRLKSEFIADITHELRSPMHGIIGLSNVLLNADETLADDKRRQYAGSIHACGQRLLRLIDDLLDLSRLEAGKMHFDFAAADIVATIGQAIEEVMPLATAKALRIDRSLHPSVAVCTHDVTRMHQVMINLLSNAIKFSSPETTIEVRLDRTEPGAMGRTLIIEVRDTGPGIPDGELEEVFDKFTQSSRTRSGAGGTGLGLSICRQIVEAHRGRIWAATNAAGGASLFMTLPLMTETRGQEPA